MKTTYFNQYTSVFEKNKLHLKKQNIPQKSNICFFKKKLI